MTRNSKSVFSNIGASTHSTHKRNVNDFYVTDKSAITLLHKHGLLDKDVKYWENACGNGVLVKEMRNLGYWCVGSDKYDRGFGDVGVDFFKCKKRWKGSIITNPPYSMINDWILHSLKIAKNKVYIFCRIQTIETVGRYNKIFKHHKPIWICPFVRRLKCYPDGKLGGNPSAISYAWFIWDNEIDNDDTRVMWLI